MPNLHELENAMPVAPLKIIAVRRENGAPHQRLHGRIPQKYPQ